MKMLYHYSAMEATASNFQTKIQESFSSPAEIESQPSGFRLYQNFPQTFYRVTRIGFDVPKAAKVKIGIYNVFGKEICILVDEELQAGNYEVVFDATSFKLEPGILMYKIKTEDFADTKKMFLLKENNIVSYC